MGRHDWVVWASEALGEDVPAWALPPHSAHEDAAAVAEYIRERGSVYIPLRALFTPEALADAAAKVPEAE